MTKVSKDQGKEIAEITATAERMARRVNAKLVINQAKMADLVKLYELEQGERDEIQAADHRAVSIIGR